MCVGRGGSSSDSLQYNVERAPKTMSWTLPNPWYPGQPPPKPRSGFLSHYMG
jgi:hypothetical protein